MHSASLAVVNRPHWRLLSNQMITRSLPVAPDQFSPISREGCCDLHRHTVEPLRKRADAFLLDA
jgi:hypothetical protein